MKRIRFFCAFLLVSLLLAEPVPAMAGRAPEGGLCRFDPQVDQILSRASSEGWLDWIEKLSGAEPALVGGRSLRLQTRYSSAMFSILENARAFDFVLEQVRGWVDDSQIEIDEYPAYPGMRWKNLVVTLPGKTHPEEIVVLAAHLDSKSPKMYTQAPGADDNATGVATLLEAIRIFRTYSFERTLQVIYFTGEEWGMLGSQAYLMDHDTSKIQGAIVMDMFGYDRDGDRCFEMHVGKLPASQAVGQCLADSIAAYKLSLTYDYVTSRAITFSDHSSFWKAGVGAVLVMENMFSHDLPGGCKGHDNNPNYHTTQDIVSGLNVPYGFDIARAGLAAAAGLAKPVYPRSEKAY